MFFLYFIYFIFVSRVQFEVREMVLVALRRSIVAPGAQRRDCQDDILKLIKYAIAVCL